MHHEIWKLVARCHTHACSSNQITLFFGKKIRAEEIKNRDRQSTNPGRVPTNRSGGGWSLNSRAAAGRMAEMPPGLAGSPCRSSSRSMCPAAVILSLVRVRWTRTTPTVQCPAITRTEGWDRLLHGLPASHHRDPRKRQSSGCGAQLIIRTATYENHPPPPPPFLLILSPSLI